MRMIEINALPTVCELYIVLRNICIV